MTRPLTVGLTGTLAVALLAGPSWAVDVVSRKSTKTPVSGQVTDISKTEVTVKRGSKVEKVPANDIWRIKWDGEPAQLNISRTDEQGGRLAKALDGYTKALVGAKASQQNLKTDIQFLIARTTAKMALADPAKLDEAIKQLEVFRKENAGSFRYYDSLKYLGQLYLAKNDAGNAKTAFTLLAQAPWNDYKMAAQIANARLLLLQNDIAGALAEFDQVISQQAKQPAELSQRYEAMLGKATCLTKQNQHAEAVKVLERVIDQVSAQDVRVQAEAYIRQGECLEAQGKTKEAVLAYLHVDVLFATEKALHAEALYHLSQLWPTVGQPARGGDARAKLESLYPNSKWAKQPGRAAGG